MLTLPNQLVACWDASPLRDTVERCRDAIDRCRFGPIEVDEEPPPPPPPEEVIEKPPQIDDACRALLCPLDDPLLRALESADIRLLSADYIRNGPAALRLPAASAPFIERALPEIGGWGGRGGARSAWSEAPLERPYCRPVCAVSVRRVPTKP